MNLIAFGLMSGASLWLATANGPAPRDITTHKPSAEQCAAAARDGRVLPGCADAADSATVQERPAPPPNGNVVTCPGDPRCPR